MGKIDGEEGEANSTIPFCMIGQSAWLKPTWWVKFDNILIRDGHQSEFFISDNFNFR